MKPPRQWQVGGDQRKGDMHRELLQRMLQSNCCGTCAAAKRAPLRGAVTNRTVTFTPNRCGESHCGTCRVPPPPLSTQVGATMMSCALLFC